MSEEDIKTYKHLWYEKNKARISQEGKAYRAKNSSHIKEQRKGAAQNKTEEEKEKLKSYKSSWYKNNEERIKNKKKKEYKEDPDKFILRSYKWKKENPEKRRKHELKYKYNLTIEEYELLLKKQDNRCVTCNKEFNATPYVDHCHKTEIVRGLLCHSCNITLGLVKENVEVLQRMIIYLSNN